MPLPVAKLGRDRRPRRRSHSNDVYTRSELGFCTSCAAALPTKGCSHRRGCGAQGWLHFCIVTWITHLPRSDLAIDKTCGRTRSPPALIVRSRRSRAAKLLVVALAGPEEILTALAEGKPSRLVGTPESPQIDFKKQPYDLDSDRGKWELGKDIAGLANLAGGVLVIGVRTEKTPGNFLEIATALSPVPVARLDREKYYNIIRDIVRPAVRFEICYFSEPGDDSKGYMTIRVEPLDEADRWALVRRMVNKEDKLVDSIGVPIRDGDQTRWLSADEVYQHLREGQRSSRGILPARTLEPEATTSLSPEDALQRLISFKDWESPVLAWQSVPEGAVELSKRMWGNEGISQALFNPPLLRSGGFNWYFKTEPTTLDDGVLASDGRRAIWVRENGMVTAAAIVTQDDMLTWAMNNSAEGPYRLNPIALIEMTLEYYRLADDLIIPGTSTHYEHIVATWKFAQGAQGPAVALQSGLPTEIVITEREANRDIRRSFRTSSQAEHDACEALTRIYAAFQFGPESIPFSSGDRIDTRQFLDYIRTRT
jgi:hypothetical protein